MNINNNPTYSLTTLKYFRIISLVLHTLVFAAMCTFNFSTCYIYYQYWSLLISWTSSALLIYPTFTKHRSKNINFGSYIFACIRFLETAISTQFVSVLLYWWVWGQNLSASNLSYSDYAVISANSLPLFLTSLEIVMDGIIFDKKYYYYPMSLSIAFLITNVIYTFRTTNNYIYFWSWVNVSSYVYGGLFVAI